MMLSGLLRLPIVDGLGKRARLADLAVDISAGDRPPVTHLVYRLSRHEQCELPWDAVEADGSCRRPLRVTDLGAGRPAPVEVLQNRVLLKRDVLDALVLDLENRQATRANDLWITETNGQLVLCAVDVGPWAVVRRLAAGLLGHHAIRDLLDWRHVEFLRGDPQIARAGEGYRRRVTSLRAAEVADLAEAVPYLHAAELLILLPDPLAADVLEVMTPERQVQVFEELDLEEATRLLALMTPDTTADLLGRLEPELARRYLERLPEAQRNRVVELLRFPESSAGGIMTNDVAIVPAGLSLGEARCAIRDEPAQPDFVYHVYVVDAADTRRLRGVLSVRELLLGDDACPIAQVMWTNVPTVDPLAPAAEAAHLLVDHHLAALPVVDHDGRLLGAVVADAAVAHLAPAGSRRHVPRVFS